LSHPISPSRSISSSMSIKTTHHPPHPALSLGYSTALGQETLNVCCHFRCGSSTVPLHAHRCSPLRVPRHIPKFRLQFLPRVLHKQGGMDRFGCRPTIGEAGLQVRGVASPRALLTVVLELDLGRRFGPMTI
jgi:hypothetical protein